MESRPREIRGAHAPRVLFAAPRRKPERRGELFRVESLGLFVPFGEAPNGAREARALPGKTLPARGCDPNRCNKALRTSP